MNQQKILDAYTQRKSVDYFAQFVDRTVVADQDHNLAVSSYVIVEDKCEQIDIDIQLLNAQIALIVMRQQQLRAKIQEIIVDLERRSGLNSIEALMEKLCPEGVESLELGEIGSTYNGLTGKNKADFIDGNARYITYKNMKILNKLAFSMTISTEKSYLICKEIKIYTYIRSMRLRSRHGVWIIGNPVLLIEE